MWVWVYRVLLLMTAEAAARKLASKVLRRKALGLRFTGAVRASGSGSSTKGLRGLQFRVQVAPTSPLSTGLIVEQLLLDAESLTSQTLKP